jgi:glutamyl-tRNA synthetase
MYREQGYLPAAFRNYLALLGWSPGDEEIVPVEELVERFDLADVQRSPAAFDLKKLTHVNGVYVRALSTEAFVTESLPWVHPHAGAWRPGEWTDPASGTPVVEAPPWDPDRFDIERYWAVADVTKERVTVLSEVAELVDFLFLDESPRDAESWDKAVAGDADAPRILAAALEAYRTCAWDAESLHAATSAVAEGVERRLGKAQAPIRVAVMGRTRGLPLFESLAVLGRDESCRRIEAALARLAPS